MKWKKFTLETTTDAVDYLGSMFDDIGIEGMEIEDNVPLTESETKGMFIDILPELPPDDGTARVSFYLDEDEDTEEKLKAVREGLEEMRQIDMPVREERAARASAVAKTMHEAYLACCVGKIFPVLFERDRKGGSAGHAPNYMEVSVAQEGLHNQVKNVKITAVDGGSLHGELEE